MITRRTLLASAAAGLVYLTSACSTQQDQSFIFLERASDNVLEDLFKTKTPKQLTRDTIPYREKSKIEMQGMPPNFREALKKDFPNLNFGNIFEQKRGYPEQSFKHANSYRKYIEDIVIWAQNHESLKQFSKPSLDVYILGHELPTGQGIPTSIEFFRRGVYTLDIKNTENKTYSGPLIIEGNEFGGLVDNLFELNYDGKNTTFKIKSPKIHLATGGGSIPGALTAPLSEYLPIILIEGMHNHSLAYKEKYNGDIPRDKLYHVAENIQAAMEAISEGATGHLVIKYLDNFPIPNHSTPNIQKQIKKYVTETLPTVKDVYQLVPAAFRWMEDVGIGTVLDTYVNDTINSLNKLKEYQ